MNNLFNITNFSILMLCLDFFFFFFLCLIFISFIFWKFPQFILFFCFCIFFFFFFNVKFYLRYNLEIPTIDFICFALQEGISKFLIFEFGIFKHSNPKFIFRVDIYKSFQNYYYSYYHYESTITMIPSEAITIIVPPPPSIGIVNCPIVVAITI